jgi:methanogenic corrinoid protein MtbC1
MLPTAMVELALRPQGWRAYSLGSRLPFATLATAIKDANPQIIWLSVSHIDDEQQFLAEYRAFHEQVCAEVAVVVGGRALSESLRSQMGYAAFCDKLQHLEVFAETLRRSMANGSYKHGVSAAKSAPGKSKRKTK